MQVAGRYRQLRTALKALPASDKPALSRMKGLCTRPSVPMIKLTLSLVSGSIRSSMGFGVAIGSGTAVSAQLVWLLECGTGENLESCTANCQACCSRWNSELCLSEVRGETNSVEAKQAKLCTNKRSGQSFWSSIGVNRSRVGAEKRNATTLPSYYCDRQLKLQA